MKIMKNILAVLVMMAVNSLIINAREVQVIPDTSAVREQNAQKEQVMERSGEQQGQNNQAGKQNQNQSAGNSGQANQKQNQSANQKKAANNSQAKVQGEGSSSSGVKKIQGARPDWSKARGARPASVERPSGSRIPKGAGKPGGAKGPGKR